MEIAISPVSTTFQLKNILSKKKKKWNTTSSFVATATKEMYHKPENTSWIGMFYGSIVFHEILKAVRKEGSYVH